MTRQKKSLFLSVLFHGILLFSIYAVSNSSAQINPPIVIDFSVSSAKEVNPIPDLPKSESQQRAVPEKSRHATSAEPQKAEPMVVEPPPATPVEQSGPAAIIDQQKRESVVVAKHEVTIRAEVSPGQGKSGISPERGAAMTAPVDGNAVEQLRRKYLKEHFAYINDLIQKSISYPVRAKKMGWSGKVVVSFIINETGRVSNERVVASSGFALLDNNLINTIRAVAPFPPPPVKAELLIPVIYRLE